LSVIFEPAEFEHLRGLTGGTFHAEEFDVTAVTDILDRMRLAKRHRGQTFEYGKSLPAFLRRLLHPREFRGIHAWIGRLVIDSDFRMKGIINGPRTKLSGRASRRTVLVF
jgi:hypothetical protein